MHRAPGMCAQSTQACIMLEGLQHYGFVGMMRHKAWANVVGLLPRSTHCSGVPFEKHVNVVVYARLGKGWPYPPIMDTGAAVRSRLHRHARIMELSVAAGQGASEPGAGTDSAAGAHAAAAPAQPARLGPGMRVCSAWGADETLPLGRMRCMPCATRSAGPRHNGDVMRLSAGHEHSRWDPSPPQRLR
jgi:hypothetical protein